MVFEECQDIEAGKIKDDILPMGSASRPTVIPVGVIGDKKSWFDVAIEFNKIYHPENHHQYNYKVGIEQEFRDGFYKDYIEEMIAAHGINDESFRKMYMLEQVFDRDMLMNEETFVRLANIHERRWDKEPPELPENTIMVASLDIAADYDRTILKIWTADWRNVRVFGEQEVTMPYICLRWKRRYDLKPHDETFAHVLEDLSKFPSIKRGGAVAFDKTGDRGDYETKLNTAGYFIIPVVFTGGTRATVIDEDGTIVPGTKSSMCHDYSEAIEMSNFGYAADEKYMGTIDYYRRKHELIPQGTPTLAPDPEYANHKLECTSCQRIRSGNKRLDLRKPKGGHIHDDEIDSDMLGILAAIYHRPVDMSKFSPLGPSRTFLPQPLSQAHDFLKRVFG
jgi:hypothetical protein